MSQFLLKSSRPPTSMPVSNERHLAAVTAAVVVEPTAQVLSAHSCKCARFTNILWHSLL